MVSQSERDPITTPTRGALIAAVMVRPSKNRYCTGFPQLRHPAQIIMDKRLLDILCCPVSKTPVRPLSKHELDMLNSAISAGSVDTVAHAPVRQPIAEALITTDRKVIYRVDDGIPVMLPEEGIGTLQLTDFPASP
jgi:uncharacterized protein YbaR (Trm112 family)